MENVIKAYFTHDAFMTVVMNVKSNGFSATEKHMLEVEELHPSFVKAILKKVMKRNAW